MDKNRNKALINIAVSILLVAVLMAGMYLRTMNTNWDEGRHLHPDERFYLRSSALFRRLTQWKRILIPPGLR